MPLSNTDRLQSEPEASQLTRILPVSPLGNAWPSITTFANESSTSTKLTPVFGPIGKEPRGADAEHLFKAWSERVCIRSYDELHEEVQAPFR